MIGIRLADGAVFPVFDTETTGAKRVILTTSHDNQDRVVVDVVRMGDESGDPRDPQAVGQVFIDSLPPRPARDLELQLTLSLSDEGLLGITLRDPEGGNIAARSVSLSREGAAGFAVPPSLTADFGPSVVDVTDNSPRPARRWGLVLLLVAIAAILGGLLWWILPNSEDTPPPASADAPREIQPPPATAERDADTADRDAVAAGGNNSSDTPSPSSQNTEPPATTADPPHDAADPSTDDRSPPATIEYRIRRGDTLWELSESFYGTPWLFPDLAEWNRISDPDLIYTDRRLTIPDSIPNGQRGSDAIGSDE